MNIGLGIGIPFRRNYVGSAVFSPSSLFANGEQGVWYDPSDLTTLFQDAAGTTPVTAVEQPVGLMLDKSKGLVLGPELVTNGTFDTAENWTRVGVGGTASISGGAASITNVAGSFEAIGFSQSIPVVSGKTYLVTATFTKSSAAGFARVSFGPVSVISSSATSGVLSGYVTSSTSSFTLAAYNPGNAGQAITVTFDNISVRELPGNHAFQTVSTKRGILSARVNLLTKTEDFSNSDWTKDNTQTGSKSQDPNGTNRADLLYPSTTGIYRRVYQTNRPNWNTSSVFTFSAKQAGFRYIGMFNTSGNGLGVTFDLQTGIATTRASGIVATMVSEANGFWRCSFASASGYTSIYFCDAVGTGTATANGTSGIYIWGASLVPANQSSLPYQRVNTATDYDTQGFPTYLKFDSIDDSMQTNSIDFTATDKMTVFAGVRKLSDAAVGMVAELSADWNTNSGAFTLQAPPSAGSERHFFGTKGTVQSSTTVASGYPAPITNTLTGIGNISGDQAILRVNGIQAAISTADQGTGNYGNYPLYIGARAGTSLFFNGSLYNLIVRGAQSTAAQIESTEQWVNGKTAAF